VIGGSGGGTTTPPSTPTISSAVTAPGPTQSGIISSYNKYALFANLQGCYDFATANGITPAQLYSWNAFLGPNGENCGNNFLGGEYYCNGTQQPSSTKLVSAPGATQNGIVASCIKFAKPPAGAGCYDLRSRMGLRLRTYINGIRFLDRTEKVLEQGFLERITTALRFQRREEVENKENDGLYIQQITLVTLHALV
jgi:hypothetical protein